MDDQVTGEGVGGDRSDAPAGTQAIRRAIAIARLVASHGGEGATLGSIAAGMGLSPSTTHRILRSLVDENLLRVDQRRYVIGDLAFELSLCSLSGHQATAKYSDLVGEVARRTRHTSYLMVRSGSDAFCLQRAEGTARVRVAPVDVGQRRPLGVGAGGMALLSVFEPAEIRRYVREAARTFSGFAGITSETVYEATLEAKQLGYAISEGKVFSDVIGLGMIIPDSDKPFAAVSLTMPAAGVEKSDVIDAVAIMREEIGRVLDRTRLAEPQ